MVQGKMLTPWRAGRRQGVRHDQVWEGAIIMNTRDGFNNEDAWRITE